MAENPNVNPQESKPDEATAKNDADSNALPISIRPELNNPPAFTQEDQSGNDKHYRLDRRKLRVEIATLIVIAAYTFIAGYQGCQMRKATKASQEAAEAAKSAAKTAEETLTTTSEQFRLDQRPWVGLREFRCNECSSEMGKPVLGSGQLIPSVTETVTFGIDGVTENTGRTPAVKMVIHSAFTHRLASESIPNYDSIEREVNSRSSQEVPTRLPPDVAADIARTRDLLNRLSEPAETVLPPNTTRTLQIIGRIKMDRNPFAHVEDRQIFYVVGKITYYSTWQDKEHTTTFCLMNDFGAAFKFCPHGNWME